MNTELRRAIFKPTRATCTWQIRSVATAFALVTGCGTASAEGLAPLGSVENGYAGFEAPCGPGEVLSGLWADTDGNQLLGVSPRCVMASDPTGKSPVAPRWYPEDQQRGEARELLCRPYAPVVQSIRMRTELDTYPQNQRFRISNLETFCVGDAGEYPGGQYQGWGWDNSDRVRVGGGTQFCPAGQVAVGVHGRALPGDGLTEFGLICGPRTGYAPTRVADRLTPINAGHNTVSSVSESALGAIQPKQDVRGDSYRRLGSPRVLPSVIGAAVSPVKAPPANPPAAAPPPDTPRMPDGRGMPGENFAPPLFDDGAQVWACANAAQASKKAGACNGMKAGKVFCLAKGYSGALQQQRDGTPGMTIAPARAGIQVRAATGDACAADECTIVSRLECAP